MEGTCTLPLICYVKSDALGYITEIRFSTHLGLPFAGTLSPVLFEFSKLTEVLIIGAAQLHGRIPTEIGNAGATLEQLSLTACGGLNGTIPTEIGLLTKLRSFSVARSEVSGAVPSEIGACTLLHSISVHTTNIDHLPDEVRSYFGFNMFAYKF